MLTLPLSVNGEGLSTPRILDDCFVYGRCTSYRTRMPGVAPGQGLST